MGKFVISQAKNGVKFNLKAANGEVIASSQVYKDEKYCRKGIASVINNAPVAPIEDQTVEGFTPCKHPKFEVYKDKAGEFRFRLKATNGQIIATGEGYKAMAGCKRGIESIKKNVVDAKICVFFWKALSGRSYFPRSSSTTISGATSVRTGGPQKP